SETNSMVFVGDPDFELQVNFQPNASTTPTGYVADTGAVYGARGNGYTYGWNALANETRDRGAVADQRWDTLNHMDDAKYGSDRTWEVGVPDGTYRVYVVMGDPSYTDQENVVDVEGTVIEDPDGEDHRDEYMAVVEVSDGRLSIQPGSGSDNAKINYVHIQQVDRRPYDEEGGEVVIEAETPMDVRQGNDADDGPSYGYDMSGYSFVPVDESAASGDRALYAYPDHEVNSDDTKNGQRLDYEVDFDTTGTYYVWVRMKCANYNDDSVHVGLDETVESYGGYGLSGCSGASGYTWANRVSSFWTSMPVEIDVTSTGTHTFNIWMREDGVYVDKIILTTDPGFTPSGEGPDESERT
ncbi:MAG: hypothetical protein V5A37_06695, partial [Halobacteriales archaeon]